MSSSIVTGDRYLEHLVRFVDRDAGPLLDGTLTLKLNPVGLHYVQSRLEALHELEGLLAGAPVDYLRAYVSDLGDHRALEHLRRILGLLTSLKVISVLPPPSRDPTPLSLLPFGRLKYLELRGCDLSTSAARGLLELRHSLEKLICHNSTDALRHVFASRIVDINDSPVWNRLSFVSCACNGLIIMDESLQLLPAVETLDLSRNQFAKAANLRKCTKLRYLDLGFNHLRSIASLCEVSSRITKLVLRNNALITLHGVEHLKSIEGLDLSYNIISNFRELEVLASLSCLQNLWLEGNPVCSARWYRAQVFSFFSHPYKLILDDNSINTKEYWERHIILASRQKLPSGYGFYFPAKDEPDDEEVGLEIKRKKYYRLASIEDEEQTTLEAGELESVSCDSESQLKDENDISESESGIATLMTKIEHMKKERSVLWLRELKEWMDQPTGHAADGSQATRFILDPDKAGCTTQTEGQKLLGESSKHAPVTSQASDGNSNIMESDLSFMDTFSGGLGNGYLDTNGKDSMEHSTNNINITLGSALMTEDVKLGQDQERAHLWKSQTLPPLEIKPTPRTSSVGEGGQMEKIKSAPLNVIDDIMGLQSSSTYPVSPPHYQEDILQRRLFLEEEFFQLSAESRSLASSSDSDTSSSEDDARGSSASVSEVDSVLLQRPAQESIHIESIEASQQHYEANGKGHCWRRDFRLSPQRCDDPCCRGEQSLSLNHDKEGLRDNSSDGPQSRFTGDNMRQYGSVIAKQKGKQKYMRKLIALPGNFMLWDTRPDFPRVNGTIQVGDNDAREKEQPSCSKDYKLESRSNRTYLSPSEATSFHPNQDQFIKDLFHLKIADSRASETCQQVVSCGCIYQLESVFHESEVALLRSCMNKLYLLLFAVESEGQEIISILGCHKLGELREVVVGLGLQALRLHMDGDVTYILLPRTAKTSEDLLLLLGVGDSTTTCSLRSWEQVQVSLLEKYICGSIKMGVIFYSTMLFWRDNHEGKPWLARSLFVVEGCLVLCTENLAQFGSLADDTGTPYYTLDSRCPIQNILEMIIELENDRCLTLSLHNSSSCKSSLMENADMETQPEERNPGVVTWKLKWFSEEDLLKFVAVVKAIHLGVSTTALRVKCIA